jgi:hypothetical protein
LPWFVQFRGRLRNRQVTSAQGPQRCALEAIADLQQSRTLAIAKEAVERQVAKWKEKTGLSVKTPMNFAEAMVGAEIRAHLAAMKEPRLGFLEKHATDPVVAGAVLGAPGFLSGLKSLPAIS